MMKVAGVTEDVTTCECCGKSNLKKTVVLDNGEAFKFYGSDCAARALRRSATAAVMQRIGRDAQYKNRSNPRWQEFKACYK
jgi:hypothetical protein